MSGSGTDPCTPEIVERISSDATFNAWKTATDTSLNGISSAAGVSRAATPAEVASLTAIENDLDKTVECILKKKAALSGSTNSVSMAQEQKLALEKKIKEAEEDVVIARDRIGYIKYPEQEGNYHGSWFPLNRPMNEKSIPILIAFTAIFIFVGLYLLSPLVGISINITVDTALQEIYNRITQQFTPATIIVLIILFFTLVYIIQRRNQPK
jgi:hypothetical protein